LTCEKTTTKRTVSNNFHSEFASGFQEGDLVIFDRELERRVFNLDGGDGMDGVCTSKGSTGAFGEANVSDLSFTEMGR